MIRNYNGKFDRSIVGDLRRLCELKEENEQNLLEAFEKDGRVAVYENLGIFGCPDEMSTIVVLASEEKIKEYVQKDFNERLEVYLSRKKPGKDYFLDSLIAFVRKNWMLPDKSKMRELEKAAEAKRLADLPSGYVAPPKETEQDIAEEILELGEEIMENRRASIPKNIFILGEFHPESCWVETDVFQGNILHTTHHTCEGYGDYRCAIKFKGYNEIEAVFIEQYCGEIFITARDFLYQEANGSVLQELIAIHKGFVDIARADGIEFTSEIDYTRFQP